MTNNIFKRLLSLYDGLAASPDPKSAWRAQIRSFPNWPASLLMAIDNPVDPKILSLASKNAIRIGELLILSLASEDETTALEHTKYLHRSLPPLTDRKDTNTERILQGMLVAMMVGLEALPPSCAQEIIDCLCDIVRVDVGSMPKWRGIAPDRQNLQGPYGGILGGALYSQVARFITLLKDLKLEEAHRQIVNEIDCPVISIGSRKGGTGKSLFLVAALLWLKNKHNLIHKRPAACCVIDLDLSGPIWQYLLFPKRNEPAHFLDDYIDMNQNPRDFRFPSLTASQVLTATVETECPFGTPGRVGHLGVHDIPGINRTLSLAAELHRPQFYRMLTEIVSVLSEKYDYVVIDNSPGFDGVSYASMGLASSVRRGAAVVLSSPSFCDLAGTFLELADYRLARIARPPVWVINKATASSIKFTEHKYTALEIAQKLQAYDGVLPATPLLARILNPGVPADIWRNVRMDSRVTDFMFVNEDGQPKKFNLASTTFGRDVGDVLETIYERCIK